MGDHEEDSDAAADVVQAPTQQQQQQLFMQFPRNIPLPQKLDLKGNTAANWKRFKRNWANYEIASRLKLESKELRTATMLTCIGQDALEIYDGLDFENDEQRNDIDVVLEKLEKFCIGATNEIYERYTFNKREQQEGESIDTYVAALRLLAKSCNYGELTDNLIRDRIVVGVLDNGLRKKLLQRSKLTLFNCIDICRAAECTTLQVKAMKPSEDVNVVKSAEKQNNLRGAIPKKKPYAQPKWSTSTPTISCKFCGKNHLRKKEECPAWGKTCGNCRKQNHFAAKCQERVNVVNQHTDDCDSDEYLLGVDTIDPVHTEEFPKKLYAHMVLNDNTVKFQLDSGATVNILPVDLYQKITKDQKLRALDKANSNLVMFNKSQLEALGKVRIETRNPKNNKTYQVEYVIVSEGFKGLLGAKSIQELDLITVNMDNIMSVSTSTVSTMTNILKEYQDVFKGEGLLAQKLHLELDNSIPAVKLPVRKVPLAVKEPLKEEIHRLVHMGILKPVDSPTDWISSMVVVMKRNGRVRLCIDPKPLNKALKRNHYPLPGIDNILPEISKAKVFTVVDAKNGFWHVPLDEESSYLTTFGTPWGRFRWTRMPFGISVAPEEFQRRLDNALEGLDGVTPIFDDILIYGAGETEAEAINDHDRKLVALLNRCREKGIKLNKEKVKFRLPEVTFMGHIISVEGLKPDPTKVEAIREMPAPTCKQDVRRLLGMVNYLQKFAPNLSDATAPLRDLLKEENKFQWLDDVQSQSFKQVKQMLSQTPVLKYFDPKEDVQLQCDASERGLGACLMQGGQPVAYASRSMTETETHYAQIEKEMLAIVFGVERFEHYVYGRPVKVDTDHKPLEIIFKKSLLSAPKRLQRMLLRLQKFHLDVNYKKGTEMYLADTLSRAFLPHTGKGQQHREDVFRLYDTRGETEKDAESIEMVQFLPVSESSQTLIRQATEADKAMQELKSTIRQGWPESKNLVSDSIRDYFPFRDELSLQNGLVFKGERLVIPTRIREDMKARVHASHIGIQGCLRRAREALYWPGMNNDIQEYIARCDVCNNHPLAQAKEPLICHSITVRPWEKIAVDFFQQGEAEYMITVDYYSSYFEVDRLHTKTAKEVIRLLKAHLARHGIPDELMSDNGPPFTSAEFQKFVDSYSFEHNTSSPGYPQSNGKVENAVKRAKSLMQKASESRSDPFLALLDWRNTPSEMLDTSPAQRMFGRRTKTLLPTSNHLLKPKTPKDVHKKLQLQKSKQTKYYNRSVKELPELHPGDIVRVQPLKSMNRHKQWARAEVDTKVDIRSYQVRTEDGRVLRRNRRHLKHTKEVPHLQEPAEGELLETLPSFTDQPVTRPPLLQPSSATNPEPAPDKRIIPVPKVEPTKQVAPQTTLPSATRTRSGRSIKMPVRLNDYIT